MALGPTDEEFITAALGGFYAITRYGAKTVGKVLGVSAGLRDISGQKTGAQAVQATFAERIARIIDRLDVIRDTTTNSKTGETAAKLMAEFKQIQPRILQSHAKGVYAVYDSLRGIGTPIGKVMELFTKAVAEAVKPVVELLKMMNRGDKAQQLPDKNKGLIFANSNSRLRTS